ncbi:bifunctional oligoribonuclease/PAP phosphatase NrnA [Veillonella sp. R32]|uniref:DHH family phosphoesterase n=1 Tax=Veillonella sp. R32 TaxID=2021312 RepID=UPI0013896E04|nr:bifunctional oligoribonuclease/PAP phosphatase NrnA [Veillonella sp. R32]KAF1682983.1 hypothetical protein VER_03930 [Veillonella sp. R32]
MAVITKEQLKTALDEANRIILTVHVHPDGDAIGSMVAFYEALIHQGKDVTMVVDDTVPSKYNFLEAVSHIKQVADVRDWQADMLLVLDASTFERIGEVGALCKAPIYNIDHHISNSQFADGLYLCSDFAATGEILAYLCDSWSWPITKTMANALYMAIATDCGFFRFSNTTEQTLRMGALCVAHGAEPNIVSEHVEVTTVARIEVMKEALQTIQFFKAGRVAIIALDEALMAKVGDDTDGYVDLIRNVDTVDIAILLKAVDAHTTRVSLRAKVTDVNAIANQFGGGGHVKAAGCTIKANIDGAIEQLLAVIA